MLLAKVAHKRRDHPVVLSRQARKQMVFNLELQTAVEPIHPGWALDVKRARSLPLKPVVPLWWPEIHLGREVVQGELNMLKPRDEEACKHKRHPLPPIRQARDQ